MNGDLFAVVFRREARARISVTRATFSAGSVLARVCMAAMESVRMRLLYESGVEVLKCPQDGNNFSLQG